MSALQYITLCSILSIIMSVKYNDPIYLTGIGLAVLLVLTIRGIK